MVSRVTPLADGAAGVVSTVDELARLKTIYGRLPVIRAMALRIIGPIGDHDQAAQVCALASFVRQALRYVADPVNLEYITTPDVLLLQIAQQNYAQGDCDDHALLFASLCEAIGIRADVVGVAAPGSDQANHVVVVAHLDDGDLTFDLVAKGFEQPAYSDLIFPNLL